MKHDNVTKYDAFMYNWSKSKIDNHSIFIFIVFYINIVIVRANSSQVFDMFLKEFPITLCVSAIDYSGMGKLKKNTLQKDTIIIKGGKFYVKNRQ